MFEILHGSKKYQEISILVYWFWLWHYALWLWGILCKKSWNIQVLRSCGLGCFLLLLCFEYWKYADSRSYIIRRARSSKVLVHWMAIDSIMYTAQKQWIWKWCGGTLSCFRGEEKKKKKKKYFYKFPFAAFPVSGEA